MHPDPSTFDERLRAGYLASVWSDIPGDLLTPVSAYTLLREPDSPTFLFESVEGEGRLSRYSFIGLDCRLRVESRAGHARIVPDAPAGDRPTGLFQICQRLIKPVRVHPDDELPPFSGGLVGFIGYDEVRSIEKVPDTTFDRTGAPDSILGLFPTVVVFDHLTRRVRIVAHAEPWSGDAGGQTYDSLSGRVLAVRNRLLAPAVPPRLGEFTAAGGTFDLSGFPEAVARTLEHIREGEVFQVVLSRSATMDFRGDPFQAYRALRMINPSPYHFYIDFGETILLGSSPEMLARLSDRRLEHVPIAGTRRRGRDAREDSEIATGLTTDPKERSEHVMLVDLGRNDLSKVCIPGTVRVERFMEIVRYSHVMHLVSLLSGEVRPGIHAVEILQALFPAGTVSGAPKVRAMEIIDSLETVRRGFYAGAVGYFGFPGSMDFCLAIRTMMARRGRLHLQAGAGIVARSDALAETEEVHNKLGALLDAIRLAEEFS